MTDDDVERYELKVICDARSHPTKRAIIDRFVLSKIPGENWGIRRDGFGSTRLQGEVPVHRTEVFGTARDGPTLDLDETRERRSLKCKLCGLEVQVRQETAVRVALEQRAGGESSIRLAALAAIVS